MQDNFKMPSVTVGQTVLFFSNESDWKKYVGLATKGSNEHIKPCAAIVTMVGDRSLNMICFPPGDTGATYRAGIKHVTDPNKSMWDLERAGFWDYSESSKLNDRVAAIEKVLAIALAKIDEKLCELNISGGLAAPAPPKRGRKQEE